jgi:2-haloacid dehalogenase
MPPFDRVQVLAFDIFGTTVDWRTGVADQVGEVAAELGVDLDAGAFADAWRDRYVPSLQRVNRGERGWAYLDALHQESLDELCDEFGIADAFDEAVRRRLVRAWLGAPSTRRGETAGQDGWAAWGSNPEPAD